MERRTTIPRSLSSATRPKMYASIGFVMCFFIGSSIAYYPQREVPYYTGPNDPYSVGVEQNSIQEPSQRLFWGTQGSNQVGGTGLWATLTNKFPILGTMFGRMELPNQYGVPNQYELSTQYGAPARLPPQYYQDGALGLQQQVYNQVPPRFGQRFVPSPSARDVGFTDDAVIVTPPFVPPVQPAPFPAPAQPAPGPAPAPLPTPTQDPNQGYAYNKPQYRLELPHK